MKSKFPFSRLVAFGLASCLPVTTAVAKSNQPLAAPSYKLGIVISVDQFRADYFMRFRSKFKGGYQRLLNQGAYFPLADHGLLQNMTAPGHAAIMSGAYPYRHHIPINYWVERDTGKNMYCVQDDATQLVGSEGIIPGPPLGMSPKNFNASTVGDELKNINRRSRTVSLAFKDRAAVLMGGRRTDATVWYDPNHCEWVTSTFYSKSLPEFARRQNLILAREKDQTFSWGPFKNISHCAKEAIPTPWSVERTLDLALEAVSELKLGQGSDTDLLTLSLSAHDYLGHRYGPNSPYLEQMTLAEDELLGKFFDQIAAKVPGGLKNVFIVLTGDHGMPHTELPPERVISENIKLDRMSQIVEAELTRVHGKPGKSKWIQGTAESQIYFNAEVLKDKKITNDQAVQSVREKLMKEPYLEAVWSKDAIALDRKLPAGELGPIADHSISARSGDLIPVFKPLFYSDDYPFTHMTHYSYDRYVPLVFLGQSFKPGTYRQIVRVIDLAPTLSSLLQTLPPDQSEGRVLTEILR